MKRLLAALLFAATVAGGIVAHANSLSSVTSKSLGAAGTAVPGCGSASWTLAPQYSVDTTTVTGVIVSGIDAACLDAGDTLTVVATTATQTATGSVTLTPATTQPVAVAFTGSPASLSTTAVDRLAAAVTGP